MMSVRDDDDRCIVQDRHVPGHVSGVLLKTLLLVVKTRTVLLLCSVPSRWGAVRCLSFGIRAERVDGTDRTTWEDGARLPKAKPSGPS